MLIKADNVCVVIFNMQLEVIPLLHEGTQVLNNCCWLADVAQTLDVPTLIIEHSKLGAPSQALKEVAGAASYLEKTWFDCSSHDSIAHPLEATGRRQVVLAGAESHVCLLQSALGLRELGYEVSVMADACSARNLFDHQHALANLAQAGIRVLTREMFFFECIRRSTRPDYIDLAMKYLDGRYIR